MQELASFALVTASCTQLTNQRTCKQRVGIYALYSRRAEVSLMDSFPERIVPAVQSALAVFDH